MPTSTDDGRTILTPQELDAMMPPGDHVHTFMRGGPILIGADWSRSDILATAAKHGAELSGKRATAMNHGAVIWRDGKIPVFVQTLTPETPSKRPREIA